MATPPTFIADNETAWNASSANQSSAAFNSAVGDVWVVATGSADEAGPTFSLPTNSGTAQTFTARGAVNTASYSEIYTSTAVVANALTSQTITQNSTADVGVIWGFNVVRFSGSDGIGAAPAGEAETDLTAPSLNITTTSDNSAIVVMVLDWRAADGTSRTWRTVNGTTPTAGNGFELTYFRDSTNYAVYVAYYPDAGAAGSKTVGISAPTAMKASIVAIEVKGSAAAAASDAPVSSQHWPMLDADRMVGNWPQSQQALGDAAAPATQYDGTATLAATAAFTETDRTEGTATLSTTAAFTEADRTQGSASLSTTAAFTEADQTRGTATVAASSSFSGSGQGQGSGSVGITAGFTEADRTEGTASLAITAGFTASGAIDGTLTGNASLATTATITASGRVQGTASLSITSSMSSSGRAEASASLSTTAAFTESDRTQGSGSIGTTASLAPVGSALGTASLVITANRSANGRAEASAIIATTAAITALARTQGTATLLITAILLNPSLSQPPIRVTVGQQTLRVTTGSQTLRTSTGHQQIRSEIEEI